MPALVVHPSKLLLLSANQLQQAISLIHAKEQLIIHALLHGSNKFTRLDELTQSSL